VRLIKLAASTLEEAASQKEMTIKLAISISRTARLKLKEEMTPRDGRPSIRQDSL
jgi:hypothetical protein